MFVDDEALQFLWNLERAETELLGWGLVDGFFSGVEINQLADEFLALSKFSTVSKYGTGWDLVQVLLDNCLLWKVPGLDRYRTRIAESVRLFSKLRQIFPDPR